MIKRLQLIFFFLLIGFVAGLVIIQITSPDFIRQRIINYLELEKVIPVVPTQTNFQPPETKDSHRPQIDLAQNTIKHYEQLTIPAAIEKATPAVVGIYVKSIEQYRSNDPFSYFFGNDVRQRIATSSGSGFIISEDGYLLTNQHVIENAKEIMVSLPDGSSYMAEKIGADTQSDIALLKIIDTNRIFPVLEFGNSDQLKIGDYSIAIGNPFGLTQINNQPTATLGIISAVDRDFGHIEGDVRVYEDMIQTDAAINSGNSGGPLINILGQVIGMNTFIYTGGSQTTGSVGIAFSIPINRVKSIVEQLRSGDIDRMVFTGILRTETVDDKFRRYHQVSLSDGLLIIDILKNSPAEKVGILRGDIITEANKYEVKTKNDFYEAINFSGLKVGDAVNISVLRYNKNTRKYEAKTFNLTLISRKVLARGY